MSALTSAGSTREWRRRRALVLATGPRTCHRCRVELTYHDRTLPTHATVGHLRRRVDGGDDALDNLAPECARCNSRDGQAASTSSGRLNTSRRW